MKKILLILLITLFIIFGGIFLFITKQDSKEINKNEPKYSFNQCNLEIDYNKMTFKNNMYYTQINSYQEYCNFKSNTTMLNMKEKDFNNKFMIVIAFENKSVKRLTLSQVFNENDTLYIGLDNVPYTEEFNENNNAISIILNNSLKASNLEIFKTIDNINNFSSDKYQDIKTLPNNYSEEQAILDGCIINKPEGNTERINTFLENVNNGIDDYIRLYTYTEPEKISITDLKFLANKKIFIVCQDFTRSPQYQSSYNYYEYDTLEKLENTHNNDFSSYKLTNSNKNELPFGFSIKN